MAGDVFCGTSGWTYPPWRGVFYPKGLPHRDELRYMAQHVSSVEINGSFYALQRPSSYLTWRDQTPHDFVFALKAPRYITHMKRLRDVRVPLANFFASGPLALGAKLGPILWQLPPNFRYAPAVLDEFFAQLPRSTGEAAYLGRRHEDRLKDRVHLTIADDRPLRHALEVRHASFATPEFTAQLCEHHIAVVVADTAGKWPMIREVTTDFAYVRLHGDVELYTSGYTDQALDSWAGVITNWTASGADVHVYFDNDVKVRAPIDAMALQRRLTN